MAKILYSREYQEYKVTVKESSYYTSDRLDALSTCQHMQREVCEPVCLPSVTRASEAQERDW